MDITRNTDIDALLARAAEALVARLSSGTPTLFLASGGSAVQLLSIPIDSAIAKNVTIGVLDERYTQRPEGQNMRSVMKTPLARSVVENGGNRMPDLYDAASLEASSRQFDTFLHEWRTEHPRGRIVVTMGMGSDMHTAGIMPSSHDELFRARFEDPMIWAVGYTLDEGDHEYPVRVTATVPFLESEVDDAIVLVTGEPKETPLHQALDAGSSLHDAPIRILRRMRHVELYTDRYISTKK